MNRFIQTLQLQNLTEYLEFYPPDLRKGEQASFDSFFDDFGMESVSAASISLQQNGEDKAVSHLRVNFKNAFSVIMEVWKLELAFDENRWMIVDKQTVGNTQTLYSVSIPSTRVERVQAVIIRHADIRIYFEDALVFYDNIPDIETAFLVVGEGRVDFEPSLEREKHQLDLVYGDPYLEEDLEYLYARCSHSFFTGNITIVPYPRETKPSVSEDEKKKVSSVFSRHYPRSFTVESPWLDSRLSVLPQGREAVFEFKTRKKGIFSYIYSPFQMKKSIYMNGKKPV